MEDSLRKQLGYHKALGMGSVHLGWIGFGVPLNFIEEQEPRPLAFRNHRSAEEEAAFVDREHEAGMREGSFVEVEKICSASARCRLRSTRRRASVACARTRDGSTGICPTSSSAWSR